MHAHARRFARREETLQRNALAEFVGPDAAHGVVDTGEDAHRDFRGVFAGELAVDLDDAAELAFEFLLGFGAEGERFVDFVGGIEEGEEFVAEQLANSLSQVAFEAGWELPETVH